MDYEWTKIYSDQVNKLLYQVTGLAMNTYSTTLAVHASDTSQSIVSPFDVNKRKYYGSNYSYVFTVSAANGDSWSSLMRIRHGPSLDTHAYTVLSSGMRMSNNGNVILAFNMQLADYSNAFDGYESRLRVGSFNSISDQMDYYYEQETWYGRAASLAWRLDPANGFFLGGNTDQVLNGLQF